MITIYMQYVSIYLKKVYIYNINASQIKILEHFLCYYNNDFAYIVYHN